MKLSIGDGSDQPSYGDYMVVKKFAILPVKLSYPHSPLEKIVTHIWLECYYEIQRKCWPDFQCTGGWRSSGIYSNLQKDRLLKDLKNFLDDPRHIMVDLCDGYEEGPSPVRKNWTERSLMKELSS